MPIYAIGDIQGCYSTLRHLLDKIHFDSNIDTLWLTGDLVNRGPESLATLRFIKSLGNSAITVLGNHDLHLLAVAYGDVPSAEYDTLQSILDATDRDELLTWLRQQPILHYDSEINTLLVHAGVYPYWDLTTAQTCARELEAILRSEQYIDFLQHMYGNEPKCWDPNLTDWDRYRFIANAFTRMRLINAKGELNLNLKGPAATAPEDDYPWFLAPKRHTITAKIIFGHWAALECEVYNADNVYAIDSGCVWGGPLTALCLDTMQRITSE